MIEFREKFYSEADATRELYLKLQERQRTRRPPILKGIVQLEDLPSVLRGNNVVIEKFVISRTFFGRDTYRMFLKMGSKVKLPKEVMFPSKVYNNRLGTVSLGFTDASIGKINSEKEFSEIGQTIPTSPKEKLFGNGGGGGGKVGGVLFKPAELDINVPTRDFTGEVVKYSQKDRSLVVETKTIDDSLECLNILPFGLNYNIYLLDA